MKPLYEIPKDYQNLANTILSCQTEKQFGTEINDAEFPFEDKNIFIAKQIKNIEAELEAVKAARDAMNDRIKNLISDQETLESYILKNIENTGVLDPIKCPEFEIKVRNNPPAVVILDQDLILDCYKKTKETITIDKIAIAKDLKEGFEVEGAKLERGKTLIIK